MSSLAQQHDCLLLDLDGTLFRGHAPTPDAVETLAKIDAHQLFVTNNASAAGQTSYDFGPVTISAFLGETEVTPNSFINNGNLTFLGINSTSLTNDNGVNSINDVDGVVGGGDQERMRLEIDTGYYLTNLTWAWSRADGPLPTDGVSISGFSSDPGVVFSGGTAGIRSGKAAKNRRSRTGPRRPGTATLRKTGGSPLHMVLSAAVSVPSRGDRSTR